VRFPSLSDVLVLCYHGVSDSWPSTLAVTRDSLTRQLELLVARGYEGATFTQAVLDPPAPRTLAVTFDDSYRSVIELGAPILARHGLPGTVFVPTSYTGHAEPVSWPGIDRWSPGPHAGELIPMSWDELTVLADAGWEIGSHTRTHPRLTEVDDATLATELEASRRDCEVALRRPCTSIAYPHGATDERVARAAGAALPSPLLTPVLPYRWPRIGVYRDDDLRRFRRKVSRVVRRMRRSGAWKLVQARHRLSG
jgi:peptidoglycan/xylan/chitin deacetylase (PgdA/CDA1 family)